MNLVIDICSRELGYSILSPKHVLELFKDKCAYLKFLTSIDFYDLVLDTPEPKKKFVNI